MNQNQFSIIIDLRWCLDELLNAGYIDQKSYHLVMTSRKDVSLHPLQVITRFNLVSQIDHQPLTLNKINKWLAHKAWL